ncbi:MAG: hypothetical protein R3C11_01900 [Planctomycetaceae bacterium]
MPAGAEKVEEWYSGYHAGVQHAYLKGVQHCNYVRGRQEFIESTTSCGCDPCGSGVGVTYKGRRRSLPIEQEICNTTCCNQKPCSSSGCGTTQSGGLMTPSSMGTPAMQSNQVPLRACPGTGSYAGNISHADTDPQGRCSGGATCRAICSSKSELQTIRL